MPDIPTTEPDSLVAGETWKWTKSLADYPASTWTLSYTFVQLSASPASFTITASASGDDHSVNVDEATTAAYTPAKYKYQRKVTDGTDVFIISSGFMTVVQDFSDGSPTDPRSHACIMADAIEASLESNASDTQLSYTIDGIAITELSPNQRVEWLEYYRKQCENETEQSSIDNNKGSNRVGFVTFTRPE